MERNISILRRGWLLVFFLSLVLATALVTPMMFLGNASGHDFQPHIASWLETAKQWHEGTLFPRWAGGANFGFGEPRFIFYPPASWTIGAALGSVLPWRMVPGAFIWLVIIVACMSMWHFASEWLTETQAIISALLFIANPYSLALIYYRSDFAEFLAGALFPLLIAGTIGVVRGNHRRIPLMAFALSGVWLANAPAAVIATYSVALILVVGCVIRRRVKGLLFGVGALLAGLLVSAFYILPAWWEQQFVQINEAASTNYNPENNFLFTRLNDPDYMRFNWKVSAIGLTLIILTSISILLCLQQRAGRSEVWWALAAVFSAAVILMFPISGFFWRHLPELKFLQFPWRWLLAVNVAFAFFGGLAGRSWWTTAWWATLVMATLATGITIAGDTFWDSEDLNAAVEAVQTGHGYDGIAGFVPRDAKPDELDENAPLVSEFDPSSGELDVPEEAKVSIKEWTVERKSFTTSSGEPVNLAPKLFGYPSWQVQVDGRDVATQIVPETGQILIHLEPGTHLVEILLRPTRDQIIGAAISVLSLISLFTFVIVFRHRPGLASKTSN